ncbi:MAG: A/G-specific adenine glycosylase [Fusobacteriaceae bacterium]|jgi:A/G-specific adenine glycosylase|nr:A/G-specific adenine glycosylase [Fusobacteriaceae bacterium]
MTPEVTKRLCAWYAKNARELPWRQTRDPYAVWLSEIMLQQTRVETVIPYYERFLRALPDLRALAEAPENRLLKLWEGLGYYSRAKNLQKAARMIVDKFAGAFPKDPATLEKLPGIGRYTAGALASICFDLPAPAVDGNVLRVVARLTALTGSVDAPEVKEAVMEALGKIYPAGGQGKCGTFTQSLMELGALVCLPRGEPLCAACPLADLCAAKKSGKPMDFPRKSPKKDKREQELTVLILEVEGKYLIRKRPAEGLLAGLWEFPNAAGFLEGAALVKLIRDLGFAPLEAGNILKARHAFTHVRWRMAARAIKCRPIRGRKRPEGLVAVTAGELGEKYALPTAFRKLLPLIESTSQKSRIVV